MTRRKRAVPRLKRYRLRFLKRPPSVMWEALLVVMFGAVMIYAYSFAKKITYGADAEAPGPTEFVRVQVLNGCGIKGVAGDVAEFLLDCSNAAHYFDVVDQGNFASFDVSETLVLDRGDAPEAARTIAALLGVDPERVMKQPLSENVLDIDVTVLLGHDSEQLNLTNAKRRP